MVKNKDDLHNTIDSMLLNLSGYIKEYKDFFMTSTDDSSELSEFD